MSPEESTAASTAEAGGTPQGAPVLRVVSGNATPEEVAAIVAVFTAASAGSTEEAPAGRRSLWTDSTRIPGSRIAPGPGAWRASALPR